MNIYGKSDPVGAVYSVGGTCFGFIYGYDMSGIIGGTVAATVGGIDGAAGFPTNAMDDPWGNTSESGN